MVNPQQGGPAVTVGEISTHTLRQKPSKKALIIVALIFGIIGGIILWRSFAATPVVASVEAEQMSLPAGASIITDSSASSGKAVKMTQNGSLTSSVSLNSAGSSLAVTARGVKCQGSFAGFTVNIDSKDVLAATAGTSSWKAYSTSLPLTATSHTIKITSNNVVQRSGCTRSLYLDVTVINGSTSTTPAPTISFSASPASLTAGQSSTLTWSSTNATSCTASGAWSGSEPTSGSQSTGALNSTSTYGLSCTGTGGTTQASSTITVTSPTTSGGHVYWGAWIDGDTYGSSSDAPWSTSVWDTFENHAGKKVSIVHYGQPPMWEQAFAAGNINTIASRGAIALMDMSSKSVPLSDIAAGKYDSSITTWADAAKSSGKPFFFRWDWEMNGTWFDWGKYAQQSPSTYVVAWKHMHDVVASRGANNVTWVWCPNTVYTGSTDLASLYPGDAYVDWACIDGYNKGPLDGDSWRGFYDVLKPTYDALARVTSKPIMIGETASNENGGSKSAWITDALQTQLPTNFPKVKAFVWFNWPIYENGVNQQWPMESSSAAQAAFAQGIANSYYASNSFGNLPALTKVQPLP